MITNIICSFSLCFIQLSKAHSPTSAFVTTISINKTPFGIYQQVINLEQGLT
jgi:hypothetical protein